MSCPCGSGIEYSACCEPLIKGIKAASSAEALMRSRYVAYVKGEIDYIMESTHPEHRHDLDKDEIANWSSNSTWLGLDIIETHQGVADDTEGQVEFVATYEFDGTEQNHHELSSFSKVDGKWYFVDGKVRGGTLVRTGPKVGRNEPCPCGSGKKFKKCCGR